MLNLKKNSFRKNFIVINLLIFVGGVLYLAIKGSLGDGIAIYLLLSIISPGLLAPVIIDVFEAPVFDEPIILILGIGASLIWAFIWAPHVKSLFDLADFIIGKIRKNN